MSGGRVLVGFLVVAFDVVFGRQAVMLGGFFVVFCGFVVCFVCHLGALWEISRRDPKRPPMNSSLAVAEDLQGTQEIHQATAAKQRRPRTGRR